MKEIKEIFKEVAESQKRTDQEIANLTKEVDRVSKEVEKVNKMVGDLTSGWGKFVEGLVEPSTLELAQRLGIEIERVHRRVEAFKDKEKAEIDILIEGNRDDRHVVLVVDAKSHFEPDDMQDFLRWFPRFFRFFSRYRDSEVMGVIASPRFGNGVITYIQKQGFWVLIPSGNIMEVLYPFKPKVLVYNEQQLG